MSGYIYRIPRVTASELRATVKAAVGFPCISFGGAAAWDFKPVEGQANLRRLEQVAAAEELSVTGDFGHAFGARAEVRWRRRDKDSYDVLILTHEVTLPPGAYALGGEQKTWATSEPAGGQIMISGEWNGKVSVVAYHAVNGAVQFLSYRKA